MTSNTFKAHLENKTRRKKNSATAGNNKGRAAKFYAVHPADRPDSSDHNKWNAKPALQSISSNTNKIKSVNTGEWHRLGRGRKVAAVPAN